MLEALDVGAAGACAWTGGRRKQRENRLKLLRRWRTYDYGRVIERIADDEAAFADERGNDGAVCGEAHSENNGCRLA